MKEIDQKQGETVIVYDLGDKYITVARFDGWIVDDTIICGCFDKICRSSFWAKMTLFPSLVAVELHRAYSFTGHDGITLDACERYEV